MPDPKSDTAPQKNDSHAPPSQAESSKPGEVKVRRKIRLNSKRVRIGLEIQQTSVGPIGHAEAVQMRRKAVVGFFSESKGGG